MANKSEKKRRDNTICLLESNLEVHFSFDLFCNCSFFAGRRQKWIFKKYNFYLGRETEKNNITNFLCFPKKYIQHTGADIATKFTAVVQCMELYNFISQLYPCEKTEKKVSFWHFFKIPKYNQKLHYRYCVSFLFYIQ
jgi:hypothetical protein